MQGLQFWIIPRQLRVLPDVKHKQKSARLYKSPHTHATSKRVFLAIQDSVIPIATVTFDFKSVEMALSELNGGPGKILLPSHTDGKGRLGVKITPTPARPISLAIKWASEAPAKTIFTDVPALISTSALRAIRLAIASALSTCITNGIGI